MNEHLDQLSKAHTITTACLLKIGLRAFKELSQTVISWVAQVALMKSLHCSDIHLGSGWSLITFFVEHVSPTIAAFVVRKNVPFTEAILEAARTYKCVTCLAFLLSSSLCFVRRSWPTLWVKPGNVKYPTQLLSIKKIH
jgi:hypothetical protein